MYAEMACCGVATIGRFGLIGNAIIKDQRCTMVDDEPDRSLERRAVVEESQRREEALFRIVTEAASDAIVTIDAWSIILYANPATQRIFGWNPAELIGKPLSTLMPERLRHAHTAAFSRYHELGTRTMAWSAVSVPGLHRAGHEIELEISFGEWREGDRAQFIGVIRDVTERKRIHEALRASEERYALAARGANDGLWDWDLAAGPIYYSDRFGEILGIPAMDIGTHIDGWLERVHPDDIATFRARIDSARQGQSDNIECEHRLRHSNGDYRWVLCRGMLVRSANGAASRMAGSLTDLTQRKATEERLAHSAFHDQLTGLPNRTLFLSRLTKRISHPKGNYAVLFLDLDRFKVINDSLGHTAGDELLIHVARRLERCLRLGDTVARLGGDEFSILLERIRDTSEAIAVAERVFNELRASSRICGRDVIAFPSVGIAIGPASYRLADEVVRDADTAMYRAKAAGGGRYQVFDETMHDRMVALLDLESDLRRAVARAEFVVHYQPIVRLDTEEVTGFEALIRWAHPERGIVLPGGFLGVAEETRLISSIGVMTRTLACAQFAQWLPRLAPGVPLPMLHLNMSATEFEEPDVVSQLAGMLRSGVPAQQIALEITESVLLQNTDKIAAVLSNIRSLGFKLSIDDFGTGYSSLSYLHRFPVHNLKIDRSFVSRIVEDESSDIVATVVTLAHQLKMEVVAEGVETSHQADYLRELGCGYAQGYYFAPPLDLTEATRVVLRGRL